jgi:hypothetical protein
VLSLASSCTRTCYDHLQLTPAAEPEVLTWTGDTVPAYPSRLPALDEPDSAESSSSSESDAGSDINSDVDSGASPATVSTTTAAAVAARVGAALPPEPPTSTSLTPPVLAHGAMYEPPLAAVATAAAAAAVPVAAVAAIQPPRQQQAQQPGPAVVVAQQVTSAAVPLPAVTAALAASPAVAATAAAAAASVRAAAVSVGAAAGGSGAVPSGSSVRGEEPEAVARVQSSDVSADVYSDIAMADLQQQGVVLYARRILSAFTDWQQQLLQQSKVPITINSTQYNLAQWRSYYSSQQHHAAVASTDYLITQLERCFTTVDELHYHQRQSDAQYQTKFLGHWSYVVHDAARTAQAKLQKVNPA